MKLYLWHTLFFWYFWIVITNISRAQKPDTLYIFFGQNSYNLDNAAKSKLNDLTNKFYQYSSITINGRSSEEGIKEFNSGLSEKRADAVKRYLSLMNYTREIQKNAFGEEHPIEKVNDISINRSAELVLYHFLSDEAQMQKFLSNNYKSPLVYDYNPAQGLKITSKDGVFISIPPNAFTYQNGQPVSGKVEVQITKIINLNEILQSDMNTVADHGPLQTAGMFEIKAFKSKQELKLKKGSEIQLNIPADSIYNDMKIFIKNDSLNTWSLNESQYKLKVVNYNIKYDLFFRDNLSEPERVEMNNNVALLKDEQRIYLNILLGGLIRERLDVKINRLINLFSIQAINTVFYKSVTPTTGITLFENKTQRVFNIHDVQFTDIDFKKTIAVTTTINNQSNGWTDLPDFMDMNGTTLKYYDVKLSNLNFVNCDRFLNYPNLGKLIVNNNQISNSKVFLVFPNLNCVIPGRNVDSITSTFSNIPQNSQAIIFAFGIKMGKWYYAKKSIYTNNRSEELEWILCDEATIQKEMKMI